MHSQLAHPKDYRPAQSRLHVQTTEQLKELLGKAAFTAEELISLYCAAQHEVLGSYQAVGKRLQLDRRTVKARIEQM